VVDLLKTGDNLKAWSWLKEGVSSGGKCKPLEVSIPGGAELGDAKKSWNIGDLIIGSRGMSLCGGAG
jgi:hypothetical protein